MRRSSSAIITADKTIADNDNDSIDQPVQSKCNVPPLPDDSLKIGDYVYTAMHNLSAAGYCFSFEAISEMTTPEWSIATFHTNKPFMKIYIAGQTDTKGSDGRVRFKADPYIFGEYQVLISKEWYERQRRFFKAWYNTL